MSVAPDLAASDDNTPASQLLTPEGAKALVGKLRKRAEPIAAKWRAQGLVNEAFVYGDQFPETDQSHEAQIKDPGGMNADLTPTIPVNLMAPLASTWEALLTKDRPTAIARAATDEPVDVYDAQITQKAIEFEQRDLNSAEVIFDAVHLANLHGTAAVKVSYDEDEDRIVWAPISIYNFLLDPSSPDDTTRAGWVIFLDYNMPLEEAKQLFLEKNIDREPTEREHAAAGVPGAPKQKGVEHLELWMKPTTEFPEGLYICLVDGEAVEITDYPLVIPSRDGDPARAQHPLPLAIIRVRKVRNSVYGNTNLTYCVPLQRAYNECVNKAQKLMRQVTNIHLPLPQSIAESFDPASSTIIPIPEGFLDLLKGGMFRFTQPGEISPTIFTQRDFFEKSMQKVIGLNDITANSDNPRLSGTAIENMVQLDAQRNADVTRSLGAAVLTLWELTLTLIGWLYKDALLAGITGGDDMDVRGFRAEDLCGTSVRLELGSEVDTTQPAKERIASDRAQMGAAGPLDMVKANNDPAYAMSRARAEQIVQAVAGGGQPQFSPDDIDPNVMADVVAKAQAMAMQQGNKQAWLRLEQFRRTLPRMQQARPGMAPTPPNGAPPGQGAPTGAPPIQTQPQPGA